MTKGLPRSRRNAAPANVAVKKQAIVMNAVPFTTTGATGVGWGTVVVGDLPQGNILLLGAVGYFQLTSAHASVGATFNATVSLGSAPTADATLNGAEVDILASAALGAATAKVSPLGRLASSASIGGVVLDNTDDSLELNLNVTIPDADISADGVTFTVSGVIHLAYSVLGDD